MQREVIINCFGLVNCCSDRRGARVVVNRANDLYISIKGHTSFIRHNSANRQNKTTLIVVNFRTQWLPVGI
jgi:hypothetical protein